MKAGLPSVHHRVTLSFKPADMEQNPTPACTVLHLSDGGTGLRLKACVQLSHSLIGACRLHIQPVQQPWR